MANFNGVDLGVVERYAIAPAPRDRQLNAYPGVNGLESLDMGARGGRIGMRGAIYGDPDFVSSSIAELIGWQQDGGQYTLIDPLGNTFNAILDTFKTGDDGMQQIGDGDAFWRYEADFLILLTF